jgi:hypothetical protein
MSEDFRYCLKIGIGKANKTNNFVQRNINIIRLNTTDEK